MVVSELAALGMPSGAKFDAIVDQVFGMQLNGRGKTPEEREKILRKLSGIKEQPKKKEKEKKPKPRRSPGSDGGGSAARRNMPASKEETKKARQGAPPPGAKSSARQRRGKPCRTTRTGARMPQRKNSTAANNFWTARNVLRRQSFQQGRSQLSARRFRIEVHGPAAVCSSARSHGFQSARWSLRNRRTARRSLPPENAGCGHHRPRQSVCRREFFQRSEQARRKAHHRLRSVCRQRQPARSRRKNQRQ